MFKYYKASAIFTVVAIAICGFYGGFVGALTAAILGLLEVSVSLDNAVVNAKILKDMDETWKKRFLTWGMLFSVFAVRFLFPILIVFATSSLSLWQSFSLPFQDAHLYATTVQAAHTKIAGYGGAFLLMVFLGFFMSQEKEHHWIPVIEPVMNWVGKAGTVGLISLGFGIMSIVSIIVVPLDHSIEFQYAAMAGIATWMIVHLLQSILEGSQSMSAAKSGFGMFIYLNVLDASFSFDGVIGAFAISDQIIIVTLGLAIGAMFVRSMTIHMVDAGTLGSLKFLEHGAFWSIGSLAVLMFLGTRFEIHEILTGGIAAAILAVAVVHSLLHKKSEQVVAV
jgi:hypothetical protein